MNNKICFTKKKVLFCFRNPIWNNGKLELEWKIKKHQENAKNDGYFYRSIFYPQQKVIKFPNEITLSDKKINGVILPHNIFEQLEAIRLQLQQEYINKKLTDDIPYTLNDNTAYGIYNGISSSDIKEIFLSCLEKAKEKFDINFKIFCFPLDDLVLRLNKDKELKQIAINSYTPYPMKKNWKDETKKIYSTAVAEKTAKGYGIIPNEIIRKKIEKEIEKEIDYNKNEKKRVEELSELAKSTNKKQLLHKWIESCNDSNIECDTDICCRWVHPNGDISETRTHTY